MAKGKKVEGMHHANALHLEPSMPSALNAPDPGNAGVGNGLWSLTNVGSTPTSGRFN